MLNKGSEGFGETKKRDFVGDDEKEEILLDSLGSGGASGISVEAYPRLSTQDYQNVALLVVLCKYDFEIIANKLHCMCIYLLTK